MAVVEMDVRLPFPFKLYTMLQNVSDSHYSSALSWKQDGQSFTIHNRLIFMKEIVPRYFKLTKFRSFTRQLNNWGFRNLNENEWSHVHFIRGNTDDIQLIRRIIIKEPSSCQISNKLRQDVEDTNEEEIFPIPNTGQDFPLQAIEFRPEIDNQYNVNNRTIPSHATSTLMGSLPLESHSNASNQPDEDAPTPIRGQNLPLQSMKFCPETSNHHCINSRTIQSHVTTIQTGSLPLPLDSSLIAVNRPNEDDDLLLMCSFLQLEGSMFIECDCSFCRE